MKIETCAFGIPKDSCNPQRLVPCSPLTCGEDSFCITETDTHLYLGIADGVAGYTVEDNGNSKVVAQSLMNNIPKVIAKKSKAKKAAILQPKRILKSAFVHLVNDVRKKRIENIRNGGRATACLISINKDSADLKFANLGDSGFIILSPDSNGTYKVNFKSEYQLNGYNNPLRFSMMIDHYMDSDYFYIGVNTRDITVKRKEVILLMTDGVFDNLFDYELEKIVTVFMMWSEDSATQLAENVAFAARKRSHEDWERIPMDVEAEKYGIERFEGGKPDDITVISAIIDY